MAVINRNGKAYDSGDVVVAAFGGIIDATEVSYGVEQDHQLNYTIGNNKATSWSRGKITPSASLSVMLHVAKDIEKIGAGDLLRIPPFPINVTFINEFNEIINDTILAKFKNQGREVTGDQGLQVKYDLFALDVQFQTQ